MITAELRDLDAQIHREVMGLHCEYAQYSWWDSEGMDGELWTSDRYEWWNTWDGKPTGEGVNRHWSRVPHYSTNIASAWLVIERLKTHFRCSIRFSNKQVDWCWWCYLYSIDSDGKAEVVIQEESASLAICLAALKFVRGVQ